MKQSLLTVQTKSLRRNQSETKPCLSGARDDGMGEGGKQRDEEMEGKRERGKKGGREDGF